jgi:hypothetical protein
MSQADPQASPPRWTFISIALFVLGLLIFVPAGLCVVAIAVEEGLGDPEFFLIALVTGGIPMAGGAGLIYAGLKMRHRDSANPQSLPLGQGTPHWTAASIALFVLGLLILVPSGLCTAFVGGSIFVDGLASADLSGIFVVLIYGGIPAAMGAALLYAALKLRRRD